MEIRLTENGEGEYRKKGADTWLPFSRETIIQLMQLTPEVGDSANYDMTIDTKDKNILHIDNFQSWYDNASLTISSGSEILFTKYHTTGGANRVETTEIGNLNIKPYDQVSMLFSVASVNAKGWGRVNNIVIS